jgi:hypothetical protein
MPISLTRAMVKDTARQVCANSRQVNIPEIQAFVNQSIEHFRQIEDLRLRKAFLAVFSREIEEYVLKDFEQANVSSSEAIKGWYTRVRDVTELRSGLEPSYKEVWDAVGSSLDNMIAHLLWNRASEDRLGN